MVFFCLLIAYPLSFFGFDNIVDTLYPVNSVLGVILFAIVVIRLIVNAIIDIKTRRKTAQTVMAKSRKKGKRKARPKACLQSDAII